MKFRKKPVAIEAITFDELVEYGKANGGNINNGMPWSFNYQGHPVTHENDNCYLVRTLEGMMKFNRGDMLITGVQGEIYPCKKDIFEATYTCIESGRKLTGHKVNGCNENIDIKVLDEPGRGGACHRYVIYMPWDAFNEELNAAFATYISFQNGPIKECGVNGITHETLLAILIDRMEGFQSGQYACADNQDALDALRKAQEALQRRTKDRVARGVEGTHNK